MSRDRGRTAGLRIVAVTVILVCAVLGAGKLKLEQKYKELKAQEKALSEQIQDEKDREREIEEYGVYIKTKKFIKDLANSVMGLVDPDSVIIKEKE